MQTEFSQDFVKTKLSTPKNKKDKFKPLFCGKDFYIVHQSEFKTLEFFTRNLCPKNRLIIYVVVLCCLRRKTDWFAGIHKIHSEYDAKTDFVEFSIYELFRKMNILWPKLPVDISLFKFLSSVKIKPLPASAQNGIFHFFVGDYDLQILDYEPTPYEILKMQIKNQRVLTFEPDYKLWPEKKYGHRDILSFLLHDFIHAEHFFSDPNKRFGQIGFYKLI
jgi:hypothetical protein